MHRQEIPPTDVKVNNVLSEMVEGRKSKNRANNSDGIAETPFMDVYRSKNSSTQPSATFKQNLRYYFSQYCNATSIHGVQYLGERGRFIIEKIFWAIIITVVWCTCIILIVKTYNKWMASPVIVTFATTETSISKIPFPAITTCPEVKFDPAIFNYTDVVLRKMLKKPITDDENRYFESFSLICNADVDKTFSELGVFSNRNLTVNESVFYDLLNAFPRFENEQDLPEVLWLGSRNKTEDLLSPTFTSPGLCFTFNMLDYTEILKDPEEYLTNRSLPNTKSKKWSLEGGYPDENKIDSFPRRTFVSGIDGGFRAYLFTNHTHLDYLCGAALHGFQVTLHHPSELPNMDKHFRLPLDQAVLIAVKPKMITVSEELKSYEPENRKCYFSNERPLRFFKQYSQRNCLDECLSNYTMNVCGCAAFYMPKYDEDPICGPGNNECFEDSKKEYLLSNSNCKCLPSCTSLQYDVEISQTDWDWIKMFTIFARVLGTYDFTELRRFIETGHCSKLAVYFGEMQFLTSERHELYGYVDFFSNTGGLLGLFIGFSVTSAIEILYFLTVRLACNIRKFGRDFWSGEPELINKND